MKTVPGILSSAAVAVLLGCGGDAAKQSSVNDSTDSTDSSLVQQREVGLVHQPLDDASVAVIDAVIDSFRTDPYFGYEPEVLALEIVTDRITWDLQENLQDSIALPAGLPDRLKAVAGQSRVIPATIVSDRPIVLIRSPDRPESDDPALLRAWADAKFSLWSSLTAGHQERVVILSVSAPAIDATGSTALVTALRSCARPLCAISQLILLRRTGARWRIVDTWTTAVS